MSDSLSTTFGLLATTGNPHAVEVLLAALDAGIVPIETAAVQALARRRTARGLLEAIRRLSHISPEARAAMIAQPVALHQALKQAIEHGDRDIQVRALELAVQCEDFDSIGSIVTILSDGRSTLHFEAGHALSQLVDRLCELTAGPPEEATGPRPIRHASQARTRVLIALDKACANFRTLEHAEPVIHAVLALAEPDHFSVKRILGQAEAPCRELAGKVLMTSTHPGVMRFIVDSLSRNYPPSRAIEAFSRRTDIEFLCHVLRTLPQRLSLFQQKNLRQVERLDWIDDALTILPQIPPGLHPRLVDLIAAVGLPTQRKLAVQEWIVRHGTPEGRIAASGVLDLLGQSEVRGIITEGLESTDEKVQAWATAQLRTYAVPQALALLVARLDSPLPEVRKAAQEELKSFNVFLLLDIYESLDPDVCRQAAMLVSKIDPLYVQKLDLELSHPVRRRRIRAARGALAMGVQADLAAGILIMLEDGDPLVRRTAAEVLAYIPSRDVLDSLKDHLSDESPRVREAVRKAVDQLRRALPVEAPVEEFADGMIS